MVLRIAMAWHSAGKSSTLSSRPIGREHLFSKATTDGATSRPEFPAKEFLFSKWLLECWTKKFHLHCNGYTLKYYLTLYPIQCDVDVAVKPEALAWLSTRQRTRLGTLTMKEHTNSSFNLVMKKVFWWISLTILLFPRDTLLLTPLPLNQDPQKSHPGHHSFSYQVLIQLLRCTLTLN